MIVYFDSLNIYVAFQKVVSVPTLTMTLHISGFNVSADCNRSSSSAQTDGNSACVCPASASSFVTVRPGSRRSSLGLFFRGEKLNQLICLQNINGTEGNKLGWQINRGHSLTLRLIKELNQVNALMLLLVRDLYDIHISIKHIYTLIWTDLLL